MKTSEQFALDEWLSDYPQNTTFDEICDLLLDESETVTPWQPFENMPPADLVENMDNTRSHFSSVTNED